MHAYYEVIIHQQITHMYTPSNHALVFHGPNYEVALPPNSLQIHTLLTTCMGKREYCRPLACMLGSIYKLTSLSLILLLFSPPFPRHGVHNITQQRGPS
jgi:hypothetical protein